MRMALFFLASGCAFAQPMTGSFAYNLPAFKGPAYIRLITDGCCCQPYLPADVLYYGGVPQSVPGLVQINAQLPPDVPPGDAVPLYFGLDPDSSIEQMVTIAAQSKFNRMEPSPLLRPRCRSMTVQ
jgi:hypothetical protein